MLDRLLAGRSRADREAEEDAGRRLLIFGVSGTCVLLVFISVLFKVLGLAVGPWALPAFVPVMLWGFVSARAREPLRPAWMSRLRGRRRLKAAAAVLVLLWLLWPQWADSAMAAWQGTHLGLFEVLTERPGFAYGAVLAAAPAMLGVVAFMLVLLAMVLTPASRWHGNELPPPPAGPQQLRSLLLDGAEEESGR